MTKNSDCVAPFKPKRTSHTQKLTPCATFKASQVFNHNHYPAVPFGIKILLERMSVAATNGIAVGGGISETDNVSALELQSNRRMLYFSDGVMEELSSSSDSETEADVPDKCYNIQLDEREMALGPRLRYKASRMGNKFLAGIDYVGGGLASLLGITNTKYASEMDSYQRAKIQGDEDLDNNWQPQNNNHNNTNRNETIVMCAPARSELAAPPPTEVQQQGRQ
ncbi:uncharacterized protein LOC117580825 [Drosophila guanche]|uniref:Uncharacterized protein n=2 Tax=Drosophila guanche TaxID=7266 RepID=A0A3B0J8A9_DROGU|nr:uncharacterized protein LOC117580825 [Drosophila guanche]SPP78397.1 Hypothetical predicted protein [Drosophila guanche]